jgi:uncharacterized protein (TIGR03437 family)
VKISGPLSFSLGLIAAALCCFDAADAQTNAVVAFPQQLTFNTQTGVTTPSQTILLSSASGTANFSVTAFSEGGWLTVTSSSSSTPAYLTVSIGSGAPTSGANVGFINVLSGTTLSIPVTLNANSTGGSSPISVSPNSLSFVFAQGSTAATSQTVVVSSTNPSFTNFTAVPVTNSGSAWLSVSPTGGGLPVNMQVTVNPGLLTNPGTFNAAIAINAPGTSGIVLPVLVTVQGVPGLTVSPSQLSFGYQLGTAGPAAETLTLNSTTGANITFTANTQYSSPDCGSWIVLNQNGGATPSTLSVQVNTSELTAGTCTGQINISAPGAQNPTVAVPVALLVSTLPLIQAPNTGPTFTYQINGTPPAAQSVQITSSTSGVNITATAAPNNSGPNFLEVTPVNGTTPQSLTLTVNPAVLPTLGPGTYTETVTLATSGAGNSPQSFDVTLTVSSNPTLSGSVQSLNFNYQVGQTAPSNQTVTITSSGAPLNYQVAANTTNCAGFLTATPATGSTFGNQNQVVVSVNPQGITPQVCSGNVTVTVPGSTSAPLVIPVTFNVSNGALLSVSQPAINVVAVAGAAAATVQTISVTSTNSSALGFSATASTNPVGLTWLAVTPNSGNTPNNLQVTINPSNLGPGVYTGSIIVSSSVQNVPAVTIPVTLTLYASTAVATPTTLTFTQAAGGSAPASQSVQIAGVPTGTTIGVIPTVLSGSSWLTASASGNTVTVTASGSQLPQGTYSGVVTVIVPGAGASPLYIPVTLDVTVATSAITLSSNSATFDVLAGSMSVPGSQSVQVNSSTAGTSVSFTASFVPSTGGDFLTVAESSANTPATLTLSVNAAVSSTLAAGTYTGTVQVASGTGAVQTIAVTLLVSPAGTPVVLVVTSGASLQTGAVSPGEIVTIFGNGIGPVAPALGTSFTPTATDTVPTTLANVTVTFNNVAAPLIFVSPSQINAIVPYEVAGLTSVPVVVTNNATPSTAFTVPVSAVAPDIFSLSDSGSGQGAILNSDASVNGSGNPAAPGSIISIFATGEGVLSPAGITGCITGGTLPLPRPVAAVSVTIGGQPASSIEYAGEAPDAVCGLLQINATIPSNVAAGAQPVVLTIGGASNSNQAITVAVQ